MSDWKTVCLWWSAGFAVALLVSVPVISRTMIHFRKVIQDAAQARDETIEAGYWKPLDIPMEFLAALERLFFVILVSYRVPVVAPAMIGWIALKLAADWSRIMAGTSVNAYALRSLAWLGVIGNLLSMSFALVGGLIVQVGMKSDGSAFNLIALGLAIVFALVGCWIGSWQWCSYPDES